MRKLTLLILLALAVSAYVTEDLVQTKALISKAFSRSDASLLVPLLTDPVDLTLPSADDSYSRAQAEVILKKFFKDNQARSYVEKHSGKSVDGSVFVIGAYETTTAKKYRTYVLIKEVKGRKMIQRIEFEED